MGVVRLGALGVVLGRLDAAAIGRAQHDRARQPPAGPVAQPPGMAHQLVDRGIHEALELELDHRPETLRAEADGETGEQGLGHRSIEHPGRAEAGEQSVGSAKHAAVPADILAQHQDARVLLHRPGEGHSDGLNEVDLAHVGSSATSAARCRAIGSGSAAKRWSMMSVGGAGGAAR